jgi:hypothetical protein
MSSLVLPDFCSGILHVCVGQGTEMRNPEGLSKIDPYLYIRHGENVSISNVHRKAGGTCKFDWNVQFPYNTKTTHTHKHTTTATTTSNTPYSSSSPMSSNSSSIRDAEQCSLEITVFDQNTARPDKKVANVSIPPNAIIPANGKNRAYKKCLELTYHRGGTLGLCLGKMAEHLGGTLGLGLKKMAEPMGGLLDVELWWEERSTSCPNNGVMNNNLSEPCSLPGAVLSSLELVLVEPFPLPCLRLVKNKNHRGGLLRGIADGGVLDILRTWQIHLWGAHSIFQGTTCGWNRNYDAAKQIYGPTADCAAIREAIRVQHRLLYSHEQKFTSAASITHIQGSRELINALPDHDVNTQHDKSIRFTYVISTDSMMNFSVTSAMKGRDFLSKHALHSNASPNVIYSGEFFVDRRSSKALASDHKVRLIMDNNSGTFAPSKEKLPMLKELLEFNFGTALPIVVLDQSDALLKELLDINHVQ